MAFVSQKKTIVGEKDAFKQMVFSSNSTRIDNSIPPPCCIPHLEGAVVGVLARVPALGARLAPSGPGVAAVGVLNDR